MRAVVSQDEEIRRLERQADLGDRLAKRRLIDILKRAGDERWKDHVDMLANLFLDDIRRLLTETHRYPLDDQAPIEVVSSFRSSYQRDSFVVGSLGWGGGNFKTTIDPLTGRATTLGPCGSVVVSP